MKRVVILGAGNVAWSLAKAIDKTPGYHVCQIYARNIDKGLEIAGQLNNATRVTDQIGALDADADIYIISVKDDAIKQLSASVPATSGALWLHTSGAVPMSNLARPNDKRGVLYPLQTFTRGRDMDFTEIPIFIEGDTPEALSEVETLAKALSGQVTLADSATRRAMHVAAVFGCNFTNHLWSISNKLLQDHNLDLTTLTPLLYETLNKALQQGPDNSQTGPARRGDNEIIEAHINSLENETHRQIYRLLSESIMKQYNSR